MTDTRAVGAVLRFALVGAVIVIILVLVDLRRTGTHPLNLIQPGEAGPSHAVIEHDFADVDLPADVGLDGQQFYAVARNPFDLDEAAESLDRPRYRLQRPLLSWLAWSMHPTGGGRGLIAAFFVVGVLTAVGGGVATGALSVRLGGPPWAAAVFGVLPGMWWSLRVTVADALALALALGALALLASDRPRIGWAAGALAVLARETAVLVLVGWAIHRRGRAAWIAVGAATAMAVAWAGWLRLQLPGDEAVGEVALPFSGFVGAVRDRWLVGDELWGMLATLAALTAGLGAIAARGLRHPLGWGVATQLAFMTTFNADVLGNDFGGPRSTMPLLALAILAILTPAAPPLHTLGAREPRLRRPSAPRPRRSTG